MRLARRLSAAALAAALMVPCLSARAAQAAGTVSVQLNGRDLTFTDAVPQVRDQRTFLPFRAVFEALGAAVDVKDGSVVAVRDGRTITMTPGSTAVTVTEGGTTSSLAMDVAPYVDPATWRTYVPVRFAAQALECAVGWDQASYTAVIVDPAQALADLKAQGAAFTYLERLDQLTAQYDQGRWDTGFTFTGEMLLGGLIPVPISSGSAQIRIQDGAQVDLDADLSVDLPSTAGSPSALAGGPVRTSLRGDLSTGRAYLKLDLPQTETGSAEVWYDLGAGAASLLSSTQDTQDYFQLLTKSLDPNSLTAYTDLQALLLSLSDAAFQPDPDQPSLRVAFAGDEDLSVTLVLELDGEQVVGYAAAIDADGSRLSGLAADAPEMALSLELAMTRDGAMSADVILDVPSSVQVALSMEGTCVPGTGAVQTAPPAGAVVRPYAQLAQDLEQAQSSAPQDRTIYITPTGKRYHYDPSCNGGTYLPSTLAEAKARGLTPCQKCVE